MHLIWRRNMFYFCMHGFQSRKWVYATVPRSALLACTVGTTALNWEKHSPEHFFFYSRQSLFDYLSKHCSIISWVKAINSDFCYRFVMCTRLPAFLVRFFGFFAHSQNNRMATSLLCRRKYHTSQTLTVCFHSWFFSDISRAWNGSLPRLNCLISAFQT